MNVTTTPEAGVARPRRALALLVGGVAISAAAQAMTFVAVPWMVLQTSGSIGWTGVVVGVSAFGSAVVGVAAGPLVDRLGFRRSAAIVYLLGGCATGALPILQTAGLLTLPLLLVLVLFGSALDAPGTAAVRGIAMELARPAGISLDRANGALQAATGLASLLGPVVGGVLIVVGGTTSVLLADAVCCLLMVLVVRLVATGSGNRGGPGERPGPPDGTGPAAGSAGYRAELRAGLRVVGVSPVLRTVLGTTAAYGVLDGAFAGLVLIVISYERLGDPGSLGVLVTAFGAGALGGAILYGAIGPRLPRRRVYLTCGTGVAAGVVLLTGTSGLVGTSLVLALIGLLAAPLEVITTSAVQRAAPPGMYARAATAVSTCAAAATPAGIGLATALIATGGLTVTIVVLGAGYLVTTLAAVRTRALFDTSLD
jgi:MFS family permease